METSKTRRKKYLRMAGFALAIVMGSSLCFSAWAQEAPAEVAITSSACQATDETAGSEQAKLAVPVEDAALEAGNSVDTEEPVPSEALPGKVMRAGDKELENIQKPQPEGLVLPEFYAMQEAQVLDLAAPVNSAGNWVVDAATGTITVSGAGPYRVQNSATGYSLVVSADTTLILENVSLTSALAAPVQVQTGSALTLVLEGENTIKNTASPATATGIYVPERASVSISGEGSLDVAGITAIGAGNENTGSITIAGGNLQATGDPATAIGGNNANITITGGNITATGGTYYVPGSSNGGAGIGGGKQGNAIINITGGTIVASGGNAGAGIGSTFVDTAAGNADITISGGEITAYGGPHAAGIGGTYLCDANITINGGKITAKGGVQGAAIGGGFRGNAYITITDGEINATGSLFYYERGDDQGGSAGIGAGTLGWASVQITGGTIKALGSYGAAGIGGGMLSGSNISNDDIETVLVVIEGGTITAEGGATLDNGSKGYGTGIGCGAGSVVDVIISGGTVTAYGSPSAAGIGETLESFDRCTVHILGDANVTAYGNRAEVNRGSAGIYSSDLAIGETADVKCYGGNGVKQGGVGIACPAKDYCRLTLGLREDTQGAIAHIFVQGGLGTGTGGRNGNAIFYNYPLGWLPTTEGNNFTVQTGIALEAYAKDVPAIYTTQNVVGTGYVQHNSFNPQVLGTMQGFVGIDAATGAKTTISLPEGYNSFACMSSAAGYLYETDEASPRPVCASGVGAAAVPGRSGNIDAYALVADYNTVQFLAGEAGADAADMPLTKYVRKNTMVSYALPKEVPVCSNFQFLGWLPDDATGTLYQAGQNYKPLQKDVVFTAQWVAKQYKVTFNANGGTGEMQPMALGYGKTIRLPVSAFARTGYDFVGWNTDENAAMLQYADEADFTQTEENDVTLYAVWKVKSYRLAFDVQGGLPTPEVQMVAYGTKATMPVPPTKAGHNFVGWYNGAESGSRWDFEKDTMPAKDMALYAHWEKISASSAPSSIVNSGESSSSSAINGGAGSSSATQNGNASSSSPAANGGAASSSSTTKAGVGSSSSLKNFATKSAMQPAASKPVSSSSAVSDITKSTSKTDAESAAAQKTTSNEVPLVGLSNSKTWGLLNLMAAVTGVLCSAFVLISSLRQRKRDESGGNDFLGKLLCALAIALGVVSAILFLVLDNWEGTMRLVTQWTPLWFIILAIQIVLAATWARNNKDNKH